MAHYVVSGTLVSIGTAFAVFADWFWTNSAPLSGITNHDPLIDIISPEYWGIFLFAVLVSAVFYLFGIVAVLENLRRRWAILPILIGTGTAFAVFAFWFWNASPVLSRMVTTVVWYGVPISVNRDGYNSLTLFILAASASAVFFLGSISSWKGRNRKYR